MNSGICLFFLLTFWFCFFFVAHHRETLESAMLPNPKRAKLFEEALRKLGFHDRASGTKATQKTVQEGDEKKEKMFKR